jgi:hypothetical protein
MPNVFETGDCCVQRVAAAAAAASNGVRACSGCAGLMRQRCEVFLKLVIVLHDMWQQQQQHVLLVCVWW